MIDTHCHIQSAGSARSKETTAELWQKAGLDSSLMIASAREAGIRKLICVGCDPDDSQSAVDLALREQTCWAAAGIHPHAAGQYLDNPEAMERLAKLIRSRPHKLVAIGECGLDYFYNYFAPELQQRLFEWHLSLATETGLPLIFHVRNAFDDFWKIISRTTVPVRGVLHSFTDSRHNLDKALNKGFYIGVNGIATFTKDALQLEMYRSIPLTRLLLETDSPYLTPTPYRGKINEPKYTRIIAEFLAELRQEDQDVLVRTTTANANNLFGMTL